MSNNETVKRLQGSGPVEVFWVAIDELKESPDNPKYITHDQLESLKQSIMDFPEMMLMRPGVMVSAENKTLIAGNQRKKACKAAGWDQFPVLLADKLTPAQLKEFMIKDNVQWGEWDHDVLKEEWNIEELGAWGLEIEESKLPELNPDELPPTSQSRLSHQKQIRLNFTEEQAETVKKKLAEIAETPELAVLILLKLKKKPETANQVAKNTHSGAGDKGEAKDTSGPDKGNKS